MDIDAGAGWTG